MTNSTNYRFCPTCPNLTTSDECDDCLRRRQEREARNDSGVDFE